MLPKYSHTKSQSLAQNFFYGIVFRDCSRERKFSRTKIAVWKHSLPGANVQRNEKSCYHFNFPAVVTKHYLGSQKANMDEQVHNSMLKLRYVRFLIFIN